jgi:CRP/FNR family transcriptional regulator, dissimilatory nitrate respiration regulator
MTLDDWSALMRSRLFRDADPAVVRSMAQRHPPSTLERGETLFQQGDPADACHVILKGRLKLFRQRADGEQAVVSIFDTGDVYFEPTMFAQGRYAVGGEAASSTRVMRIGVRSLRRAMEDQPQLALGMLSFTAQHIGHLIDQVETLKILSASQRVADFLVRRIETAAGSVMIRLPYEKSLVASHLGMSPENFSRALAHLRKFGVAVERDRVQIDDVVRLADYVGHAPAH